MSDTRTQRPNWANGITLTSETTAEDVTNYIYFKINEYTKHNFKDKSLWDSYQEDFDNFEVHTFKDADKSALKGLKRLLRRNGVWVFNKKSKSIPQALYDVAHEYDRTEWSDEEIKQYIDNEGPFNSYAINYRLKSRSLTPLTPSAALALALAVSNDLLSAQAPSAQAPPKQAPSAQAPSAQTPSVQAPPASPLPPAAELPPPTNVAAPPTNVTALSTNVTAVSNDLPTAEPPSPTNTTAPPTDVTAPPAQAPPAQAQPVQAPLAPPLPPTVEPPLPTNVTAPPANVTASSINVTAPPPYNPDTVCCLPCKSTASKITSTTSPKRLQPTAKRLCRYACNPSDASTVLPHTIDKLIAPLCLLLRHRSHRYVCDLPIK